MAESHADVPLGAEASTSGRVSQRDLPLKPGYYNKRDDTVPCGALNVKLLRCYKDASAFAYGPCKPEYEEFWECMRHHRPPHKEVKAGAFMDYVKSEGWPWVVSQAQQLKEAVLGGGSAGASGGGGGGGGSTGSA